MDWKDSVSLVLPLVYAISTNITQLVERREQPLSPILMAVHDQLRRFSEYSTHNNPNGECLLFAVVRDLLSNFALPTDPPVTNQQSANQIISSPAGQVGSSPSPMMHSPMQNMNQSGGQPNQSYGMAQNQGPN